MEISQSEVESGAARGLGGGAFVLRRYLTATALVRREVGLVSETAERLEVSVTNTREAVAGMLGHISSGAEDTERMQAESERVSEVLSLVRESALQASARRRRTECLDARRRGEHSHHVSGAMLEQSQSVAEAGDVARELSQMAVGLTSVAAELTQQAGGLAKRRKRSARRSLWRSPRSLFSEPHRNSARGGNKQVQKP